MSIVSVVQTLDAAPIMTAGGGVNQTALVGTSKSLTFSGTNAEGGSTTYSLDWGDETSLVTGTATGTTSITTGAKTHTYTVAGSYVVSLTATDAQGNVVTTRVYMTVSADVPAAPTITGATDAATGNVTFTAGAANGAAITKYQYKVGSGGTWTDIDTPADVTSPVTIAALEAADELYLRAVNSAGNGAASAPFTVTAA